MMSKRGRDIHERLLLGLYFVGLYFVFCVLDTFCYVFDVCVDMCFYLCVLYEHVFIYGMSYLF